MRRLLAALALALPLGAAAAPARSAPDSPAVAAQKADFRQALSRVLKEGTTAQVSSIGQTLGFAPSLHCTLLRYRQDDSPDDAEHVFAVFYDTAPRGWRLVGVQVSREKGHLGIDGKTVMSATAWRLDMTGLIVRAIQIPEGPIDDLKAEVLGVGRKTIEQLRGELKFYDQVVDQYKLKPAR